MNELNFYNNDLVTQVFSNLSIDKKRLPSSGLTESGVPSFVAEWLLDKIVPGIGNLSTLEHEKVNNMVMKAFPRKDDKERIKYQVQQGEEKKLIALLQVRVPLEKPSEEKQIPLASIPVLNLPECDIEPHIIEQNPLLLGRGIWGKITLNYAINERGKYNVNVCEFDPFQTSEVNIKDYGKCREKFTFEQWRDLLLCSMGLNPEDSAYNDESKIWILSRLLPLVESNYHVMELAPKGTGKSFFYENVNSKVKVISGGKITAPRLFFNGKTGEIGLLGTYDVAVLDEVQSLTFDNPDEIIGPLKTYLANGRYNRSGFADINSDCSLVLLANIELDAYQRPKNEDNLIKNLPKFFSETALLDRFMGIIPGWKIPKFQLNMRATQIGLKTDFFGEVLFNLRKDNRFYHYAQSHTRFISNVSGRDQIYLLKSASGFLKLFYPSLNLTEEEYLFNCLKPARFLRQQIHSLLYNLDDEYKQYEKEIIVDVM
ncbi:BREX system Lon protease-like protein BrxL [Geminocystis herdmanii]|uniref:BREX system Lon protease-like protein BrxL n=1 Tax=Geminocystis herdmanii TaxID=669359 RepID=UPI00034C7525|nr:BREX system Lon protease-like protein BrxL [Geminocystis herdmanii]